MKQPGVPLRAVVGLAVLLAAGACRSSHDLKTPEGQAGFGVEMARMNLWREAMFRFQRAIALDPNDAEAYNNLAVAYEANGDADNAAKAYREAMRLDKSNQYIQKNYSRFVEFTSRNKKRQAKAPATGTAAPATAPANGADPAQPPASGTPAPPATEPPSGTPAPPQPPPGSDAAAPAAKPAGGSL